MAGQVIQGQFLPGWATVAQARVAPVPARYAGARGLWGQPADAAGAVAPRRVGPPAPAFAASLVQRRGDGAFAVDPQRLGLATCGGRPLVEAVRGQMEAALGADFSMVRVHEGPQAERVGAIAFTTGSDIYFAPGRYQPQSVAGRQLLGHELAHVVQQRQGRVRNPFAGTLAVVHDRALEVEADRLGHRAATYRPPTHGTSERPLQQSQAHRPHVPPVRSHSARGPLVSETVPGWPNGTALQPRWNRQPKRNAVVAHAAREAHGRPAAVQPAAGLAAAAQTGRTTFGGAATPQSHFVHPNGPRRLRAIQRQLVIGGEVYEPNDAEYLFERIYKNLFSDDIKLVTKVLSQYLRHWQLFQYENMTAFILDMNRRLLIEERPDRTSVQEVQKNVIQYWAGGPMKPAAMANVRGWISKAKQKGWKHYFMTDSILNDHFYSRVLKQKGRVFVTEIHLVDQIAELQKLGSTILECKDMGSPQYKAYQAQTVKEGGFTNIPFMSDLARFYALHRYGGLYMDVDVAPGTVDLNTYFTVNHIPFLGPLLRMTEDAKNAGVYGAKGPALERKLLALFGKNDINRGMHYMMSAKGSPTIKKIYHIANKGNILGNGAVVIGIERYFRENVGVSPLGNVMTLTLPPDLPKVGWVTEESDNIVN